MYMKIAVMQPYFIPYIGYWQLINAVNTFVIYDDVNYIKRGWINRNRILVDGESHYFNIPVTDASQNKKINEIKVNLDFEQIEKKLRTIEYEYKRAPYFDLIFPLFEKVLMCNETKLSSFIENSLFIICDYLDIKTEFIESSSINKNCGARGQEKILDICKALNAKEYYNAFGGQKLYSFNEFRKKGIQLNFIKSKHITYKQFNNVFQSDLSILDIMMFNSQKRIKEMLEEYDLITE